MTLGAGRAGEAPDALVGTDVPLLPEHRAAASTVMVAMATAGVRSRGARWCRPRVLACAEHPGRRTQGAAVLKQRTGESHGPDPGIQRQITQRLFPH
jgi:hypothetical protein